MFESLLRRVRRTPLGRKEGRGVAICKAETSRKTRVERTGSDKQRAARIEMVAHDRQHAEPGQRLAAPADRRPGGMRAAEDVHVDVEQGAHAVEHGVDIGHPARTGCDFRLPRQAHERPSLVTIATQHLARPLRNRYIVWRHRRSRARAAAHQTAVAPDDHAGIHAVWRPGALELDPNYAAALLNLAILNDLYLRDNAQALALYERYQVASAGKDPNVTKWIADLKNRKGDKQTLLTKKEQS